MYRVLDDAFFSTHSWHALHPFSKFTDQQSRACINNLMHVSIQVVYINTFHRMFMVCYILTPMVEARR